MMLKKLLPGVLAGIFACLGLRAQTFETRCTRYSGEKILENLNASGNERQIAIRDSIIALNADNLSQNEVLETFFNGYHLGLVIYRDGSPFELLGFWDPQGKPVPGGSLVDGTGEVRSPFHPELTKKFKSESVIYESGLKNGACVYYCDCASVLRKGTFSNNKKTGLWKEFEANGKFIRQDDLDIPDPPKEVKEDQKIKRDWEVPAHCMMRPDLEQCPNPNGGLK